MKKIIEKTLLKTAVTLLVGYIICSFIMYNRLSTLKPQVNENFKNVLVSNVHEDLIFEPVNVQNFKNNLMLSSLHAKNSLSNKLVILAHGHNDSKYDRRVQSAAKMFFDLGYSVLVFDFQNHGESDRVSSKTSLGSKEYTDIIAIKNKAIELGYKPKDIVFWGVSFGGAVNLIAAQIDDDIETVIVDSGFSDINLIMKEEFKRYKIPTLFYPGAKIVGRFIFKNPIGTMNPLNLKFTNLKKILVIHSTSDSRVGYHHALLLKDNAEFNNIDVHLLTFNQINHGEAVLNNEVAYKDFLQDHLK